MAISSTDTKHPAFFLPVGKKPEGIPEGQRQWINFSTDRWVISDRIVNIEGSPGVQSARMFLQSVYKAYGKPSPAFYKRIQAAVQTHTVKYEMFDTTNGERIAKPVKVPGSEKWEVIAQYYYIENLGDRSASVPMPEGGFIEYRVAPKDLSRKELLSLKVHELALHLLQILAHQAYVSAQEPKPVQRKTTDTTPRIQPSQFQEPAQSIRKRIHDMLQAQIPVFGTKYPKDDLVAFAQKLSSFLAEPQGPTTSDDTEPKKAGVRKQELLDQLAIGLELKTAIADFRKQCEAPLQAFEKLTHDVERLQNSFDRHHPYAAAWKVLESLQLRMGDILKLPYHLVPQYRDEDFLGKMRKLSYPSIGLTFYVHQVAQDLREKSSAYTPIPAIDDYRFNEEELRSYAVALGEQRNQEITFMAQHIEGFTGWSDLISKLNLRTFDLEQEARKLEKEEESAPATSEKSGVIDGADIFG